MPDGTELDPQRAGTPGIDAQTPPPMAPPAGTPNADDPKRSGETEQAKANVQMAIMILEQSLPKLGSDSEEGAAVLKALSGLSKLFSGKKSADLVPAELMQLLSGMPDQNKQQIGAEMGAGPGGSPGGPHIPANMNP